MITFGLLFIVGANFWQFVGLMAFGGLLFVWLVLSSAYRLKRFTGFLDPFKDPYGTGFQLSNSLMAFGRGEWVGEGLGNSIQKLEYLPEAHTDFVMAVVGEEFGFRHFSDCDITRAVNFPCHENWAGILIIRTTL